MILINKRNDKPTKKTTTIQWQEWGETKGTNKQHGQTAGVHTHSQKKYTFMCLLLSRVEPRADKGLQSQHARILSVHP